MFSQDNLQDLKAASGDWLASLTFLIMFIGVVVGPLMMFVIGGRSLNTQGEPGLVWSALAITLLLLVSIGVGIRMYTQARVSFIPLLGGLL